MKETELFNHFGRSLIEKELFREVDIYIPDESIKKEKVKFGKQSTLAEYPENIYLNRKLLKKKTSISGKVKLTEKQTAYMYLHSNGHRHIALLGLPCDKVEKTSEQINSSIGTLSLILKQREKLSEYKELNSRLIELFDCILEIYTVTGESEPEKKIVQTAKRFFKEAEARIWYTGENGEKPVRTTGVEDEHRKVDYQPKKGLIQKTLREDSPFCENDLSSGRRRELDSYRGFKPGAMITVPLRWDSGISGVLEIAGKGNRNRFSENDLSLAKILGKHISTALHRNRRYKNEKKRKEKQTRLYDALTLEKAKRDTILESITSAVIVINQDLSVDYMNLEARRIMNSYSLKDAIEDEPSWLEDMRKTVKEVVKTSEPGEFKADIEEDIYTITAIPIRFFEELKSVAVVMEEITELYKMNEVKTKFISHLSHELKTPITSIEGAVNLIRQTRGEELTGKEDKLLSMIKSDTKNMTSLISDVMDLAKIEAGLMECTREKTDIENVIEKTAAEMNQISRQRNIRIKTLFSEELPSVYVDKKMMKHLLKNLFSNALKYSPPGEDVTVYGERNKNNRVKIYVIDQGEGIPEGDEEKIFEKFYQSSNKKSQSTGLGLSICRNIVEAFNGKIKVEDSKTAKRKAGIDEAGAVFSFTLPINYNSDKGD